MKNHIEEFMEQLPPEYDEFIQHVADLNRLAQQYKGDVETRLKQVREEWDAAIENCHDVDSEVFEDFENQVNHWKATLAEIERVLEKVGD